MTKSEAIHQVILDNNGVVNLQILYLEIEKYYPEIKKPEDWKAALRGIINRDVKNKKLKRIEYALYCLNTFDELRLAIRIPETESLFDDIKNKTEETTKVIQATIRIGQNKFRKNLLKTMKKCPISGVSDKRLLIASHIKPWAFASDFERLDISNGFLFSPTIDKLFDKGLITFDTNKKLIISKELTKYNSDCINIEEKIYENLPTKGRELYLEFHRNKIFIS